MKPRILFIPLLLVPTFLFSQITVPAIRANFGVDADLRSNFYNGLVQSGNDDWYSLPGSVGTGAFVIDTTGAAAIVARYAIDPNFRKLPFFRTMRYPQFSVVNNRLLIDAVFIRDYHGDDSTIFASGANKNGMSPQDWSCPVSQQIPDKNDILDMFVHVRRAGPNSTDSLWMFGGVSIENTTGNRYFDFEMYQTDIYYDRPSRQFYNYGPDAGHTSWKFDAAGNVTVPGDIIFTAEYGSSTLTVLEARIWVDKSALSMTPTGFNWSGQFDGASSSSQFGYASIQPKTAGAFYTGLQSANNTWAGAFQLIREDNSLVTDYTKGQFMEFSVNLTKLGLDPVTLLGGSACGMPFRRILAKTRASTSFTAELKDFVGPFDFFLAPRADAEANLPVFCGRGYEYTDISVLNPSPTSFYTWTTPNGHILTTPPDGPTIRVDSPGIYIVKQYLQQGCSVYATDTVVIRRDTNCITLPNIFISFQGSQQNSIVNLSWTVSNNQLAQNFEIQKSGDGINFNTIAVQNATAANGLATYMYMDRSEHQVAAAYYRIICRNASGGIAYSKLVRVVFPRKDLEIAVVPNPARTTMQLNILSPWKDEAALLIYNNEGKLVFSKKISLQVGENVITVNEVAQWARGMYSAMVQCRGLVISGRALLSK